MNSSMLLITCKTSSHELKALDSMNNSGVDPQFYPLIPICRPSILSLHTCMYLRGVANTKFLYVTTMEPLLGSISFWTSRGFTYGSIQCKCLVHYEMLEWPIPWFISCYSVEVKVSKKTLVHWGGSVKPTLIGVLQSILVISPSFNLRMTHHCFCWIPHSSRNIISKFEKFSQVDQPICGWITTHPESMWILYG